MNTATKIKMDMCRDEIKSHLDSILNHWNNSETRYAFHEADSMAVKLRELCDMEDHAIEEAHKLILFYKK